MRLWTVHPRYLDAKGLVALWREALLAKRVLQGRTVGYRHHPQLERFRAHPRPRAAINAYLAAIWMEASARGYAFDRAKFRRPPRVAPIRATRGQVAHEWAHLLRKLSTRDPARYRTVRAIGRPAVHPMFSLVPGDIASWERPVRG